MSGRILVFIACSLDGFIAGPGDTLDWLPQAPSDGGDGADFGYDAFMAGIGALLMGRNTYRVVEGFEGPWPYGDCPVLVATHRPLTPKAPTVRAVAGEICGLIEAAREAAGDRDVYLDGGQMIRAALDAGLVDEMTVSIAPTILGAGSPLFAGVSARCGLERLRVEALPAGMIQLTYRPLRGPSPSGPGSGRCP